MTGSRWAPQYWWFSDTMISRGPASLQISLSRSVPSTDHTIMRLVPLESAPSNSGAACSPVHIQWGKTKCASLLAMEEKSLLSVWLASSGQLPWPNIVTRETLCNNLLTLRPLEELLKREKEWSWLDLREVCITNSMSILQTRNKGGVQRMLWGTS